VNAVKKLSNVLAVLAISLVIGACSKSVEEAIDCSHFERSSSGTWRTKTDVDVNYTRGWGLMKRNNHFGPEVAMGGGSEGPSIVAALEKKCAP
jgi:hypothetical protein